MVSPGPEVRKKNSCSIQLSIKFFLLINVKMPTIQPSIKFMPTIQLSINFFLLINVKMSTVVGILTFLSRENSILGVSEPEKAEFLDIFLYL